MINKKSREKTDDDKKNHNLNDQEDTETRQSLNTSPYLIKPKRWRGNKIVLTIAGIIILSIVTLLLIPKFQSLFFKDIAPIDDSDLSLKTITPSDNKFLMDPTLNAYFDLIKIENPVYMPEGKSSVISDMLAGKTWDNNVAEEIISNNQKSFRYFTEANNKQKFQDINRADPINITTWTYMPPLNNWRNMSKLSAIRALYLTKQGKDKEAMNEALNSVGIGQKIQESQIALIEYLVANSMKVIGLETIQKILTVSKLSSDDLKQYGQDLNKYYKNEDGLISSMKMEYHISQRYIDRVKNNSSEIMSDFMVEGMIEEFGPDFVNKIKSNYYFQPNKTKSLIAENTRANISNVSISCNNIKTVEITKQTSEDPEKLYVGENAVGKILHDISAIDLTSRIIKKCQEDVLIGATQVLIAIKAYKNNTGNYPDSLTDLVPSYLSSVPRDPFDEQILKYSAEKKIVYSIGEDMQDSGGSTGDDWRKMPDITFKINF